MTMAKSEVASLEELDKESFLHPFTSIAAQQEQGPHIMTEADGIRVRDRRGREYIDAMAGLWCVNIGYGRQEMADAIAEQARKLPYFHSFMAMANEPAIRLSDRLVDLAPEPLSKVFFGNTGSDANDTQVKLIWYYNNLRGRPNKKKILSRRGSYHGVTVVAASMTGLDPLHRAFDLPLERFIHVARPHHYWDAEPGMSEREFSGALARDLEERIEAEGPETVAAFIAEPIMGAGGVIVPPEGYFEAIVPVLKKHDVLLISDEVICGFGRLGTLFGCNHYGFSPDLMTLAKGLTSAYVPMSACLLSQEIWEVLRDGSPELGPFAHGYTYSAHPLAAAAALKNLDIMERESLVQNAAAVGAYFQQRLTEAVADHPMVGEKRGVGLVAGVELVADKAGRKAFDAELGVGRRLYLKLLEEGLICRPIRDILAFSPPLIVTRDDVDSIVGRFCRGLDRLTDDLTREGLFG